MQTGQKIAHFREKAGYTQELFAEKLFVSRELVSKWETGKRIPDSAMIKSISVLLNVNFDDILSDNERFFDELSVCIPKNSGIDEKEFAHILNSFLKTLTDEEKCIFLSRYYYMKNSSGTAGELGMGQGKMRKKLMKIRNKLTDFIKEDSYNGK